MSIDSVKVMVVFTATNSAGQIALTSQVIDCVDQTHAQKVQRDLWNFHNDGLRVYASILPSAS